jgi:hypothetical protein
MKLFTGWVMSAGLVLSATVANAQVLAPYETGRPPYSAVSDVEGRYAGMPPEAPVARYGPMLLPPQEVYTIVRESGFSPLGIPQQRGLVYTISVIDRGGDDGRLVIDARTGRILRFMPAYRMGNNFNGGYDPYGPPGLPPPAGAVRGEPRSPELAPPRVASRTPPVPLPKPPPPHAGEIKPLAAKPAPAPVPAQQSATVQAKPADAPLPAPAAVPVVEAKPTAPQLQPTQEMPKAQGLD